MNATAAGSRSINSGWKWSINAALPCCGGQQCVAAGSNAATRRRRDSDGSNPRTLREEDLRAGRERAYCQPLEHYACPEFSWWRAARKEVWLHVCLFCLGGLMRAASSRLFRWIGRTPAWATTQKRNVRLG